MSFVSYLQRHQSFEMDSWEELFLRPRQVRYLLHRTWAYSVTGKKGESESLALCQGFFSTRNGTAIRGLTFTPK
jgi:hypothetical protein